MAALAETNVKFAVSNAGIFGAFAESKTSAIVVQLKKLVDGDGDQNERFDPVAAVNVNDRSASSVGSVSQPISQNVEILQKGFKN